MAALALVKDPEIGRDLVSLGMVKTIEINEKKSVMPTTISIKKLIQ